MGWKQAMERVFGEEKSAKIRHGIYSTVRHTVSAFRNRGDYADSITIGGQTLSGAGERARFGGTKPMYIYGDEASGQWLYKEAVTCVGTTKRTGAFLTEAGAKLQATIDPATAIEARTGGIKEHGFGSFQRKIATYVPPPGERKVDLFDWQKNPDAYNLGDIEALTPGILREHTTDWLLCNFDTKGENFLIDSEKRVRGIDKEQSFSHIFNPEAQTMNTTFQPNPNNTLYNTIFSKYARGEMNLNLDNCMAAVRTVEAMDDGAYMAMFKPFLDEKCAKPAKDGKTREDYEYAILERKAGLGQQYREFFTGLVNERMLHVPEQEKENLRKMLGDDGKFRFPDERRPELRVEAIANAKAPPPIRREAAPPAPAREPISFDDLGPKSPRAQRKRDMEIQKKLDAHHKARQMEVPAKKSVCKGM